MTVSTTRVVTDERDEHSNLIKHAKRELSVAGVEAEFADALLDMVRIFASGGHSGGSASACTWILDRLLTFKPLTPISDDPAEWNDVSDFAGRPLWQNVRDHSVFSTDGGKTEYSVDGTAVDGTPEGDERRQLEVATVTNAIGFVMYGGDRPVMQIEVSEEQAQKSRRAAEQAIDHLDILRRRLDQD